MISEAVEEVLNLVQNATQMFKAMNANPNDIIVKSIINQKHLLK